MKKNISTTLFVMMIAMASSFAVTIILGRNLSVNDFGEFALLKQIVLIGSTIAIFGLDYSYIKIFINNQDATKVTHWISMTVVTLLTLTFVIILKFTYSLDYNKLTYIGFSIMFGSINLYLAAIYRLRQQYFKAQMFAAGWKILLLLVLMLAIYNSVVINLLHIYQLLLASLFVYSSFIIKLLFQSSDAKTSNPELKKYLTYGLIFWMINSTGLISGGIDKLVIPIAFGTDVLGIYTAVSFIFTISLTMVGSAIGYVIYPRITAGEDIKAKDITTLLIVISVLALFIFRIFGIELVDVAFSGKYNEFINLTLVYCFTIIGLLQIVHTILHFIISAKGTSRQLIGYWILTLLSIAIFILLLFYGRIPAFSTLINLSIAVITTRTFKIFSMIIMLRKIKHNKGKYPAKVHGGEQ